MIVSVHFKASVALSRLQKLHGKDLQKLAIQLAWANTFRFILLFAFRANHPGANGGRCIPVFFNIDKSKDRQKTPEVISLCCNAHLKPQNQCFLTFVRMAVTASHKMWP